LEEIGDWKDGYRGCQSIQRESSDSLVAFFLWRFISEARFKKKMVNIGELYKMEAVRNSRRG
jgi:hypothetical protein